VPGNNGGNWLDPVSHAHKHTHAHSGCGTGRVLSGGTERARCSQSAPGTTHTGAARLGRAHGPCSNASS
jgi:hypothetical protein